MNKIIMFNIIIGSQLDFECDIHMTYQLVPCRYSYDNIMQWLLALGLQYKMFINNIFINV